jgi:hypothetical protein
VAKKVLLLQLKSILKCFSINRFPGEAAPVVGQCRGPTPSSFAVQGLVALHPHHGRPVRTSDEHRRLQKAAPEKVRGQRPHQGHQDHRHARRQGKCHAITMLN